MNFQLETGFAHLTVGQAIMIATGLIFIAVAVKKEWEPLELLPIGAGMILANLPLTGLSTMPQDADGAASIGFLGIILEYGLYSHMILPQVIFFCIGTMTDFGPLIGNPKSFLLGGAAQAGIFFAFFAAVLLGFGIEEAASIGIIGGADGPTTIYTTGKLAPDIIGITSTAAYSYMAMVAFIQPPIITLLTTKKERAIQMKPMTRKVSRVERLFFAIFTPCLVILIVPKSAPLVGLLFLGNLFRESGVVDRLTKTAQNELANIVTIFLMLGVGASMPADKVLEPQTLMVLALGLFAFSVSTAAGVLLGKLMNLFGKEPFNPMLGAAGVSAVPMSARVVHHMGQKANKRSYLLMHAMGPNSAGVIGSAVAAGYFLQLF